MAAGKIAVTEGSGKNLQTFHNTIGADDVHAEAVTLVDSTGAEITALPVTGPLTDTQLRATAVPVSAASLPLPSTAATSTKQSDGTQKSQVVDGSGNVIGATSNALDVNVKSSTTLTVNPHAVTNAGTFAVQATGTVTANPTRPATPTQSSVANSVTSVTVLASNASRLGATIFNDDTAGTGANLKLKLGATASSTSFSITLQAQDYYEVPFGYTGIIDGIASAATGSARVTEITA